MSGAVGVLGPESTGIDETVVTLPSGEYSLLVCGYDFGTTNEYGDDGDDSYAVWLWPGPVLTTKVLKDAATSA
jgi:hypothetical protein